MSNAREQKSVEWVWAMPNHGINWCTCKPDPMTGQPPHHVTKPLVVKYVTETLGSVPERVTNQEIGAVALELWKFHEMTPPVAEGLMRSVKAVNGDMADDYPLATAMAAIKHFSNTWNGEPAR